jgi:hypothetical protein
VAIEERTLPASNQWQVKATGDDIPKLAGMLTETANEAYRKAFHKNEGNWERITDPQGNPTVVPKDKVDEYKAVGYGRAAATVTMVMPEVPWERKSMGPGKHKLRYDKATKQMVEVH